VNTVVYTWRRSGIDHYLETTIGDEDSKTLVSWRCWASLEPAR
jgi:hypothetical protein